MRQEDEPGILRKIGRLNLKRLLAATPPRYLKASYLFRQHKEKAPRISRFSGLFVWAGGI